MKYSEIKTMKDLEQAQESIQNKIDAKENNIRSSFMDVKESYTPTNILRTGLHSLSSRFPVDSLVFAALDLLKRKLAK